jgi:hypothetical protein
VDNATNVGSVQESYLPKGTTSSVYSVGGLYLGEETDSLPHGIYIQSGKKAVK